MELSDLPEPAPHADTGTDAFAPNPSLDRAEDVPAPRFKWPYGIQTPPSPDAIDNARRGTWVMNDYLDGWTLMGANGRPVMCADGSRVAFWFRDIDRLAREWAPTEGSEPPTTKRRAGLAALDSGFDSDWDPATGRSYRADVTKSARLLAYYYAQSTEPEEAVRRAVAMVLGDPVTVKEGNIDAFAPKRHNLAAVKAVADAMWTDLVGVEPAAVENIKYGVAFEKNTDTPDGGADAKQQVRTDGEDRAEALRAKGDRLRRGRVPREDGSIFHFILNLAKGAVSGARNGVQNAIDLLAETGNDLNEYALDKWGVDLTIDRDFEWPVLPDTPAPESTGGKAAQWVAQFMIEFGPIVKALRYVGGGAPVTNLGTFAEMEAAAAGASAVALDPLEQRLADFWVEQGLPQGILTDFLKSNPDDTRAEGALKNVIESLGIGAVAGGGLFLGAKLLRALKGAEKAKAEIVNPTEAEKRPLSQPAPPRVPTIDADPNNLATSIAHFISRAFKDRGQAFLRIGRVSDSVADQAAKHGVNIRGFEIVIPRYDAKHALSTHGARPNEIPLRPEDFARIPDVVATGRVQRSPKDTHQGLPVLHFIKQEEDGTTFVVEIVNERKARLSFKTMYRLRKSGGGAS